MECGYSCMVMGTVENILYYYSGWKLVEWEIWLQKGPQRWAPMCRQEMDKIYTFGTCLVTVPAGLGL
jgi:hypothetical protein